LVEGARRGQRGHAYLLQVLLILELWQQMNVDDEYSDDSPSPLTAQPATDHA
jgi:hypothetical protein